MIYLDYNATTPIDKEVEEAMRPFLSTYFGNPSSRYSFGFDSRKAVEHSREQVAALIGAAPEEIVFTSGGTESDNHAIKGAAFSLRQKGNHIIVSAVEHPAVLEVTQWLKKQGFEISILPVDTNGFVNSLQLEQLITPQTILISVMHANNEVGSIQPIAELSAIARRHSILFHTDAAQSAGKIRVNVHDLDVDLLTLAGHKLYAPKGIGVLYIRKGVILDNLIHGAGQERSLRAGTENILEIVGLGKAAEIGLRDLEKNNLHLTLMRNLLRTELEKQIPEIHFHSSLDHSLPNTLSVAFRGIPADTMLSSLPNLAASAGAACHPAGVSASHVLEAMHVETELAMGTIRFSTGKYTTANEIMAAVNMVAENYYNMVKPSQNAVKHDNTQDIKLTKFSHGLGCACKIRPADLEAILARMPKVYDKNVLVGNSTGDDGAVYKINENQAVVQTLDFFTPIVDNPYDFGAIAAANALSDIYAMGAKPLFALNIVAFPVQRLPLSVLNEILLGATDKAAEAAITIIGGHSIDDTEPKFGMSVTGIVHPDEIWKNIGCQTDDALILTKPLGTGIISTAIKNGLASKETEQKAIEVMKQLNKLAAELLSGFEVHACTDVTGFGLMGHLSEMTVGSMMDAHIEFQNVPFIPGVKALAMAGAIPGGTQSNYDFFSKHIHWSNRLSETERLMICDAQTSGGLLVSLPMQQAVEVIQMLQTQGITEARIIGSISGKGTGRISVL